MPFKIVRKRKEVKKQMTAFYEKLPWITEGRKRFKNFDEALFVCTTALLTGFLLGAITGHHGGPDPKKHAHSTPRGPGLIQRFFAPVVSVPGMQDDGSFVFADFEAVSDFKIWSIEAADMEMSPAHASSGNYSAQIRFLGNTRMSAVRVEDYFSSRYAFSDWAGFKAFRFHVFNPEAGQLRLILEIKDKKGDHYKQDVIVQGGEGLDVEIPVEVVRSKINVRKIGQINLFVWQSQTEHEFYLDHVRLTV